MNKIVTISRQFSSGGREVGKRLADALNCSYYDKELIEAIAKETGLVTEYLNNFDEISTRVYPYTFATSFTAYHQSPSDKVQLACEKIITDVAKKSDAVIIGRCADYILKDQDPFKVYIYASDMNFKVERCYEKVPQDRQTKTEKQMIKEIKVVDKQRAKYNEYYTGRKIDNMENYNLCIDTSKVGIKKAVEMILLAINE